MTQIKRQQQENEACGELALVPLVFWIRLNLDSEGQAPSESMGPELVRPVFVALAIIASTCPGITEAEIDISSPPSVRTRPAMPCSESPSIHLMETLGASLARLEPVACAEMTRADR